MVSLIRQALGAFNVSATSVGISLGALLDSLAVAHGKVLTIGWVAAACEMLALVVLRAGTLAARLGHPRD